jgi:hypothetical protein
VNVIYPLKLSKLYTGNMPLFNSFMTVQLNIRYEDNEELRDFIHLPKHLSETPWYGISNAGLLIAATGGSIISIVVIAKYERDTNTVRSLNNGYTDDEAAALYWETAIKLDPE